MTQRKASIELMRFFAAALVVYGHARQVVAPGDNMSVIVCIIVDFFFLLSGFFAMRDAIEEEEHPDRVAAGDAVLYSLHKAKGIFDVYTFALILMFVIRTALKDTFSLPDVLKELFHFKWEFLMIHMAGFNPSPAFNVDYLLGPVWFLSSMLIALVPFFFLGLRFGRSFSGVIAPVCAILCYATIIQTYGTIDVGNQFVGFTMLGNLRAFAGLCTGAFVFHVNGWLKKRMEEGKRHALLQWMDPVSWVMALSLFVLPKGFIPDADALFWLFPFSVLLLNCINDCGIISHWLNHHGSRVWDWLGRLSMYIYLFHMQVIYLWMVRGESSHPLGACAMILLIVIAFSALVMTVREKLQASRRKVSAV